MSVKDEMLHDEHGVEEHANAGQPQLHRISFQSGPITLKTGIDHELE